MIIDVPKISEQGSEFEGEEPADILGLEGDPLVRVETPLRYHLTVERISEGLLVRGRVEAGFSFACSRCGAFFSTNVEESCFLRDVPLQSDQIEVDVTDDLREAVLLRIPTAPLCGSDCAGVCPHCGVNRNQSSCQCRPPPLNDVWSVLDELAPGGKENESSSSK